MIRKPVVLLIVGTLTLPTSVGAFAGQEGGQASERAWPVVTSLKTTLKSWAKNQGWPTPQFLTDADWPVDVPGSIPGSIESALKVLAQGFGHAASRPRIEISTNHVILVSETGAE